MGFTCIDQNEMFEKCFLAMPCMSNKTFIDILIRHNFTLASALSCRHNRKFSYKKGFIVYNRLKRTGPVEFGESV